MKLATALLLFSAFGVAGQAMAQGTGVATLQDLDGKVLVNKGNGLVSGKAGTALMDGDRIVTLDKSGARVLFADGCAVTLGENQTLPINAELGCKALPVASTAAAATGLTTGQMALIGAGVVGLGVAIAAGGGGSSSNDTRPISNQ